ncbi:LysR substrate-binding domain-containing protein [Phenylobacterium sp. LjRoot225]|uniref:LysR substrate-binding domain-containing protein n=1 Tax=Phenylobacterium sp. LjRoot225 TaxID=3342285 RepID=UPI003ECD6B1A
MDGPIAALAEGRADLALLLMPPSSAGLDLMEHRRVGRLGFATVVRADLDEAAALALPQIVASDFAPASRSFGVVEGRRYWRVSSHAMKAELILAGLGWGALPAHLVETPLRDGRLKAVDRQGQGRSEHDIFLYRRAEAPRGPVATALWEAFGA